MHHHAILLLMPCLIMACQPTPETPRTITPQTAVSVSAQEKKDTIPTPSSASQMKESATLLLNTLSAEDKAKTVFTLDDEEARTTWSNLPGALVERAGMRVGELSENQRQLLHNLIRASTSSQGYHKISGIMWLDDILHEQSQERLAEEGNDGFFARLVESWSSNNYWFSFFGNPAQDVHWGWLITGHHLSVSFTVAGDKVAFTPMFLGAEPHEVKRGPYAGWRTLSHEVERGFELIQSLSDAQKEQAVLSASIPQDIIEGPGKKANLTKYEGLPASTLTSDQKILLWRLVREYVANADHDAAEAQLAKVEKDGSANLYFSWIGPSDDIAKRYYYRVHGPSILIEYIRERGVGEGADAANHIHVIVRDPSNDYGEDWLQIHYEEHHSSGPGSGQRPPR